MQSLDLGKPQKVMFLVAPATKQEGGGGCKGRATKKKILFLKIEKKNADKKP